MQQDARRWTAALRNSHDALVTRVKALTPDQLRAPSYCREWDVSQVISHLGSGAEISLKGLERAVDGRPALSREEYPLIWDRWNAMNPGQRAEEMVVWDRRSVSVTEGLDDTTLSSLKATFFGTELQAVDMIAIRLGEHSLHTWDVAVSFDDGAELAPDAAALLVQRAPLTAERTGKADAAGAPRHIQLHTTEPTGALVLSIEDKVTLAPDDAGAGPGANVPLNGSLTLPAAALVRLVYGRLDPAHTPPTLSSDGDVDLDELRRVFAGL